MKKLFISLICILCLLCISCTSNKYRVESGPSVSYKVDKVILHQISLSKHLDILTYGKYKTMSKDEDHHYAFTYDSLTTQCYASENGKIIVAKQFKEINFDYPFKIRYEDDKGTYCKHGYKFIGSDSLSLKSDWVYVVVSSFKSKFSENSKPRIYILLESKHFSIDIYADEEYKKNALNLLDLYTKERFNVKLHLKDSQNNPLIY
jgi:hypothetical protein